MAILVLYNLVIWNLVYNFAAVWENINCLKSPLNHCSLIQYYFYCLNPNRKSLKNRIFIHIHGLNIVKQLLKNIKL